MTRVHRIPLPISNAYLVTGPVNFLVDTGSPGEAKTIIKFLAKMGLKLSDLSLILHTHGHSDHYGSTHELVKLHPVPTMLHSGDLSMALSGSNGPIATTTLFSRLLRPLVDKPFQPYKPQHLADNFSDLNEFGLNAMLHHTPGHSEGSISIALDSGDIIIGDILMGGIMGGAFFPTQPGYHYFIEDREKLHQSIETILQFRGERYWVGHGGPFSYAAIARWYDKVA
jgi:glyoxylase-like metal-dependent hydrolase (beta-lactamase superfamily II)